MTTTGRDIELEGFWADAEVISVYTRAQAIEDGELIDMTEWASADKGFHGGFTCPVAMTRALWSVVQVEGTNRSGDTRGRAHDVLWMASLALRRALRAEQDRARFSVKLGRSRVYLLAVIDGDGVTIGQPEDF
jgi:hypothetical protein